MVELVIHSAGQEIHNLFTESENSLACSQEHDNEPNPEPDESNPTSNGYEVDRATESELIFNLRTRPDILITKCPCS
jgi:hypothetical protein